MRHRGTGLGRTCTVTARIVLTASIALLALPGCATIQRSNAMDKERTLAAAGFQMKFADTPEQLSQIQGLPQRKLTRVPDGTELRFVYADSNYCKCLYVGTESAYDRYQRIALQKEIAAEQLEASSMNWGPWGAWGPWY
jgi:hypothetical protein